MIARIVGAVLVGAAATGVGLALVTALLLAIGGWTGGRVPWDAQTVTDAHAMGWALVWPGLIGVVLRGVAAPGRRVGELGAAAVLVAVLLAAFGFVEVQLAPPGFDLSTLPRPVRRWSPTHVSVLWSVAGLLGGLGLVVASVAGRSRGGPLPAAGIVAGAYTALAHTVYGYDAVRLAWDVPPDLWVQLRTPDPLVLDAGVALLLAGGFARALRPEGASPAVDRGLALALALAAAAAVVGWTGGPLLAATGAALAYPVDGLRRGILRATPAQPLALAGLAVWSVARAWAAWDERLQLDLYLHDTFVGLAPGHLNAIVALCALLAGVAPGPGPTSRWGPWGAVAAGCAAVVAAGALLAVGFVRLGFDGLPRRYWVYTDGAGWGQLLAAEGALLVGCGVVAAGLGWAWLSRDPPA